MILYHSHGEISNGPSLQAALGGVLIRASGLLTSLTNRHNVRSFRGFLTILPFG
jgi:hypothetical protein